MIDPETSAARTILPGCSNKSIIDMARRVVERFGDLTQPVMAQDINVAAKMLSAVYMAGYQQGILDERQKSE